MTIEKKQIDASEFCEQLTDKEVIVTDSEFGVIYRLKGRVFLRAHNKLFEIKNSTSNFCFSLETVKEITLDNFGGYEITLKNDYRFQIIPDNTILDNQPKKVVIEEINLLPKHYTPVKEPSYEETAIYKVPELEDIAEMFDEYIHQLHIRRQSILNILNIEENGLYPRQNTFYKGKGNHSFASLDEIVLGLKIFSRQLKLSESYLLEENNAVLV